MNPYYSLNYLFYGSLYNTNTREKNKHVSLKPNTTFIKKGVVKKKDLITR